MKNIHIIPADKSRLYIHKGKLYDHQKTMHMHDGKQIPQDIYITSLNEDINENDYIITKDGRLVQVSYLLSKDLEGGSKVILTTDQDLIKDGVQDIDDKFLEWFIKNPSCEEVKILRCPIEGLYTIDLRKLIPKEEHKPEYQSECICDSKCRGFVNVKCKKSKQESLEEAAENYANQITENDEFYKLYVAFKDGAKWQQKKL